MNLTFVVGPFCLCTRTEQRSSGMASSKDTLTPGRDNIYDTAATNGDGVLVSILVLCVVFFAREAKRKQSLLKAVTAKIEDLEKQNPEGVFIEGDGERAHSEVRHCTNSSTQPIYFEYPPRPPLTFLFLPPGTRKM